VWAIDLLDVGESAAWRIVPIVVVVVVLFVLWRVIRRRG
jgi:hypothetical protein